MTPCEPSTEPEALLIHATVVSAALQALIGRLTTAGLLDKGDLVAMRETGLQLAADLAEFGGLTFTDGQMAHAVERWWNAAEDFAGC